MDNPQVNETGRQITDVAIKFWADERVNHKKEIKMWYLLCIHIIGLVQQEKNERIKKTTTTTMTAVKIHQMN